MVSPLSENLFLRGISESGSIPAQWTISYNPLLKAQSLAEQVDCPTDSTSLLVKCLQNKPLDKIVKAGLWNNRGVKIFLVALALLLMILLTGQNSNCLFRKV